MTLEKEAKLKRGLGIIIGIMFFAVVALGVTYAYFAGSVSGRMNTIASTESVDIQYSENRNYMYGSLVPASEEDAIKGATNEVDNGICKDSSGNDYYVCSLYEFTVDNMSNVNQDIEVYLYQQINGYENLKYMVYETSISESNFDVNHKVIKSTSLVYPNEVQTSLGTRIEGLTKRLTKLDNSVITDSVTYTIVFYVENMDYNQSEEDGGKQIVADIHVVSKTSDNSKELNLIESVGVLKTGVKYYYDGSTSDYVVFYEDYFINKHAILTGGDLKVMGFNYNASTSSYYVYFNNLIVPLTNVSQDGNSFSIDLTAYDMGSYNLTIDSLTDTLPVTLDNNLDLYTNALYFMTESSGSENSRILIYVNDGGITNFLIGTYSFVEIPAESGNFVNIVSSSDNQSYNRSDFTYNFYNNDNSINYTKFTYSGSDAEGVYSLERLLD